MPMSASPRLRASSTSDDPFTSVVKLTRRAAAAMRGDQVRQHQLREQFDAGDADGAVPGAGQGRDVRAEAVEVLEHVHDVPGQHLADRRQGQAARRAFEQGRSNLLFELENLAADRRGGDVQDARCSPDRAGAADGVEVLDGR